MRIVHMQAITDERLSTVTSYNDDAGIDDPHTVMMMMMMMVVVVVVVVVVMWRNVTANYAVSCLLHTIR